MKVYKRDGKEVDFDLEKIKNAILKANVATFKKFQSEINSDAKLYSENEKRLDYDELLRITDSEYEWNEKNYKYPETGKENFVKELSNYILCNGLFDKVLESSKKFLKPFDVVNVEDISDIVEKALMKHNAFNVAKEYILYRNNKRKNEKFTESEQKILTVIDGTNDTLRGDNANKHIDVNSSARDYIAGVVCKSIADKVIPNDILKADKQGYIHWHDKDYSPVQHMTNCGLVDVEDMFINGFQMGDAKITRPRRISIASNLMSQISLIVSGLQYGGQTASLSAFLPIMNTTRVACAADYASELTDKDYKEYSELKSVDNVYKAYLKHRPCKLFRVSRKRFNKVVEKRVRHDIHVGIKTYAWQILCHHSSNGQSPFTSLVLNLREAETEQELKDLAILIEEVIKRRIKGVTGQTGQAITPLFPKLLYWTCDGLNVNPEDPYYYLTKLAAQSIVVRMSPDINSEKMCRKIKTGQIIPSMGCRSHLTPLWIEKTYPIDTKFHWQYTTNDNLQYEGAYGLNFDYSKGFGNYSALPYNKDIVLNFRGNSGWVKEFNHENKTVTIIQPRVYGRWNNGVITINIPLYAGEARIKVNKQHDNDTNDFIEEYKDEYFQKFYKLFDKGLELCHQSLLFRDNACKKIQAKNSPLLWMHGAYLRESNPEKTLGEMMKEHPLYNTISLGYVGLYETCEALLNKSNSTKEGQEFSLTLLKYINNKIEDWKKEAREEGNDTFNPSLYGTPEEQLTHKFALALKKHLGEMKGVTDHDYVTNSYHISPGEKIDWKDKIKIEGQYLSLTKGGAISYIETDNLKKNPEVIEEVIRFIHDNNSYCEVNTTLGMCYCCGYQGDFYLKSNEKHDNYYYECPKCHNINQYKMLIVMRLCGYIGKVNAGETTHGRMADFEARQHARHIKVAN